ncbi:hypothetical protein L21SP2_0713 [Salinispira pacifica]|uniref:Uncharacterized protein n=1 Tax=Salinispira pacifica TaxID=1307761 RepID=V5WEA9_9SPIO|nr:hypothetical protein L21SP2_0713 [Salinispira pacifica]
MEQSKYAREETFPKAEVCPALKQARSPVTPGNGANVELCRVISYD